MVLREHIQLMIESLFEHLDAIVEVALGTRQESYIRTDFSYDQVCNGPLRTFIDQSETCFEIVQSLIFVFDPQVTVPQLVANIDIEQRLVKDYF